MWSGETAADFSLPFAQESKSQFFFLDNKVDFGVKITCLIIYWDLNFNSTCQLSSNVTNLSFWEQILISEMAAILYFLSEISIF